MKFSTETALILVEGKQEAKFVKELKDRNLCRRDNIVRHPDGLNGNESPRNLAKIIDVEIRDAKFSHGPVFVLFDREDSRIPAEQIKSELKIELSKLEHVKNNDYEFVIGVADRSIESWIFPYVGPRGEYPVTPVQKDERDEKNCKNELKRRLKVRNITYNKMKVGVELLHAINPGEFSKISSSFCSFYNEITQYHENTNRRCKWLNKGRSSK